MTPTEPQPMTAQALRGDPSCRWCQGNGWYWYDPGPEWSNDECRRYCYDCDIDKKRKPSGGSAGEDNG